MTFDKAEGIHDKRGEEKKDVWQWRTDGRYLRRVM